MGLVARLQPDSSRNPARIQIRLESSKNPARIQPDSGENLARIQRIIWLLNCKHLRSRAISVGGFGHAVAVLAVQSVVLNHEVLAQVPKTVVGHVSYATLLQVPFLAPSPENTARHCYLQASSPRHGPRTLAGT